MNKQKHSYKYVDISDIRRSIFQIGHTILSTTGGFYTYLIYLSWGFSSWATPMSLICAGFWRMLTALLFLSCLDHLVFFKTVYQYIFSMLLCYGIIPGAKLESYSIYISIYFDKTNVHFLVYVCSSATDKQLK